MIQAKEMTIGCIRNGRMIMTSKAFFTGVFVRSNNHAKKMPNTSAKAVDPSAYRRVSTSAFLYAGIKNKSINLVGSHPFRNNILIGRTVNSVRIRTDMTITIVLVGNL